MIKKGFEKKLLDEIDINSIIMSLYKKEKIYKMMHNTK
jgi:hypothetical protein